MNARIAKKIEADPDDSGRYTWGQRLRAARIVRRRRMRGQGVSFVTLRLALRDKLFLDMVAAAEANHWKAARVLGVPAHLLHPPTALVAGRGAE